MTIFPILSVFPDKVVAYQWIMHEHISMIIPHDNRVQLPPSIVNDSSIAHFSDPSPLKFQQISNSNSMQNTRFKNTNHKVTIASIQSLGIIDQFEMINILKFLLKYLTVMNAKHIACIEGGVEHSVTVNQGVIG